MTTQTEALKLALEALEQSQQILDEYMTECVTARQANNEAITAIKEALMSFQDGAQPAVTESHKQEPVAHSVVEPLRHDEYQRRVSVKLVNQPVTGPLYTLPPYVATPPQRTWIGLTDEEIDSIDWKAEPNYARALEAKLKEKNNVSQ